MAKRPAKTRQKTRQKTRTESDAFGPLDIPADRLWGAQTERSLHNFRIGTERMPVGIVRALGLIDTKIPNRLLFLKVEVVQLTPLFLGFTETFSGLASGCECVELLLYEAQFQVGLRFTDLSIHW